MGGTPSSGHGGTGRIGGHRPERPGYDLFEHRAILASGRGPVGEFTRYQAWRANKLGITVPFAYILLADKF